MKRFFIYTIFFTICIILLFFFYWRTRDNLYEIYYDWTTNNKIVTSKKQIDNFLNTLETHTYQDCPKEWLDYTQSNTAKYKSLVQDLTYYKIPRTAFNRFIVGDYRLKHFICRDSYYKSCVLNKRDHIICIFNKKIFYKLLELQEELEKQGYNKNGFEVVNGHRHPTYNEQVKGASQSRHIKGEAVDLSIYDINNDGYSNKTDKDIVLDILENKIIKNEGGLGLYPGTQSVHYDVRGHRARWNSY